MLSTKFCQNHIANDDEKAVVENLQSFGDYLTKATFVFHYPETRPPRTETELKTLCKSQSEAFKSLREKTKGARGFIRRGFLMFVSSRQVHHRKYCTNTSSEPAQKFVAMGKCIMDKKFDSFRQNEMVMAQTLNEIARRNYNDSSLELKQICCTFYNLRMVCIV